MSKILTTIFSVLLFAISSNASGQQVFDSILTTPASDFQTIFGVGSGGGLSGGRVIVDDPFLGGFTENFASAAIFDLADLSGPVTSASLELSLEPGGFDSNDAFEEFVIHDVSTSPDLLIISSGNGSFFDFSSGVLFGATNVEATDEGSIVSLQLNADGIAEIDSSAGGLVAFGASVSTLDGTQGVSFSDVQLVVETATVPEPACGFVIGLLGLGLVASRRKRN